MRTAIHILILMCLIGASTVEIPQAPESKVGKKISDHDSASIRPIRLAHSEDGSSNRAHAHPHGDKVCASGCSVSNHPTPTLTQDHFNQLITALTWNPADTTAINELLYYGPQARARLLSPSDELSSELRQYLLTELSKSQAVVQLRLVDLDSSDVIASLPSQTVPLDLRHEFDLIERDIPSLTASGTIKRVGRHRLWSRL